MKIIRLEHETAAKVKDGFGLVVLYNRDAQVLPGEMVVVRDNEGRNSCIRNVTTATSGRLSDGSEATILAVGAVVVVEDGQA